VDSAILSDPRERERERDHGADFQVQIIDGIDTGRDQSHESHDWLKCTGKFLCTRDTLASINARWSNLLLAS
jgi:hypothetical protein